MFLMATKAARSVIPCCSCCDRSACVYQFRHGAEKDLGWIRTNHSCPLRMGELFYPAPLCSEVKNWQTACVLSESERMHRPHMAGKMAEWTEGESDTHTRTHLVGGSARSARTPGAGFAPAHDFAGQLVVRSAAPWITKSVPV